MNNQRQKLSVFAASQGLTYQAAWKLYNKGQIEGIQLESGTILVSDWVRKNGEALKAVIYVRVSPNEGEEVLKEKIASAEQYAENVGYDVVKVYSEIVHGLVFNRPQLKCLMEENGWDVLLVNDSFEISQLNFETIQLALNLGGKRIETINPVNVDENVEPLVMFSQKFINWAKQILGTGSAKKDLINMLRNLNR
jgi:putative resolvase